MPLFKIYIGKNIKTKLKQIIMLSIISSIQGLFCWLLFTDISINWNIIVLYPLTLFITFIIEEAFNVFIARKEIKEILENDKDYQRVFELYGETHTIEKRIGTQPDLTELKYGESVIYGDGKTYHWLLTEKK